MSSQTVLLDLDARIMWLEKEVERLMAAKEVFAAMAAPQESTRVPPLALTRPECIVIRMRRRGITQSDMAELVTVPARKITHRLVSTVLSARQPTDVMKDSMSGKVREALLLEMERALEEER